MWKRVTRWSAAIATTVILTVTPAAPSVAAGRNELETALDRITAAGMPGVLAEMRVAGRTTSAASGVADVDSGRKMQPYFRHRIGSITKTFAATTLLQLVGEGKVRLDAPVAAYLPQYQTPGVTVRMLLNHTSGIGDFDEVLFQTGEDLLKYQHTTFMPDQLARFGLAAPRTGPPGGPFTYSNTNYVLVGLIIEKATGRPAPLEMYRRIVAPLGLWRTYPAGATSHIIGPHSQAYIPWYDGTLMDFSVYNMSWAWMLGDIVSTTHDLNVFYKALLTGKLLRANELRQMQTTVPFDPSAPEYGGYGLGLYSLLLPCGILAWGHDGVVSGNSTISLHTPTADRQITLGENMTHYGVPGEPDPVAEATADALMLALCGPTLTKQAWTWRSPVEKAVRPGI